MVVCYVSLGSNSGDRLKNIRRGIKALRELPRTRLERASSIYESSPVGKRRQRDFLNCCAKLGTELSPMGLLVELKRIEAQAGRRPSLRWSSRPLDIDILFYGGRPFQNRFLTIPHPRALDRRFVMEPLVEIAPPFKNAPWHLNAHPQNVILYRTASRRRQSP